MSDLRTAAQQEPVADRAAFERHAKRLGYSVDPDTREGREGGYWSSHTHLMWQTWQAALEQPEQPDWLHLKRYGYAPGNYMNFCKRCGVVHAGLDKRATCCKPCAEVRHAFEQQNPGSVCARCGGWVCDPVIPQPKQPEPPASPTPPPGAHP
jgi:hypothetical protein